MERVIKNDYGFYELKNRPSSAQLNEYYTEKYYQNYQSTYQVEYTNLELEYIENKLMQKKIILEQKFGLSLENKSLLDIGCGEGYSMSYFENLGMNVKGIDYSEHGITNHNKKQLKNLFVGEINQVLNDLILNSRKFDLILLDNILEHVENPTELVSQIYKIISNEGILIIEVPNDFSNLQMHLLNHNLVEIPYWIAIPDHLSYFTKDSLENFCKKNSFENLLMIADFPLDLNLLYENSNYISNPKIGLKLHQKRMVIENYLTKSNVDKLIEVYINLADMGLGRNITGYFKKQ